MTGAAARASHGSTRTGTGRRPGRGPRAVHDRARDPALRRRRPRPPEHGGRDPLAPRRPARAARYQDHELGVIAERLGVALRDRHGSDERDGVILRFTLAEGHARSGRRVPRAQPAAERRDRGRKALDGELEEAGVTEPNVTSAMEKKGVGLKADERSYPPVRSGRARRSRSTEVNSRDRDRAIPSRRRSTRSAAASLRCSLPRCRSRAQDRR